MAKNVQRRLAAILAADAVGYSRLVSRDETSTLDALRAHRKELIEPQVAKHEGRIVKLTGDGLLAEFSSAVSAVRCAAEVQQAMADRNAGVPDDKRITYRMGIDIGEIVVEDEDIFGDGVNVAARLEALCDPGGICVSRRVQEDVAGKVDLVFENLGEKTLKNIPRAVRVYRVRPGEAGHMSAFPGGSDVPLSLPDKPSIAVLPFANMSGVEDQEHFADGVSEDIITALSRIHWLFVIASHSSFVYKGRKVDVRQMARDLGVRYVLEGSVRRLGARVRISAQLIDTASGSQLWSERYDRELSDIFALQDEITRQVAAAIEPRLLAAEGTRVETRTLADLDAWELVARASSIFWRMTRSDTDAAMALLAEAVRRHPSYALAHSMLAFAMLVVRQIGWSAPSADLGVAAELASRAAQLDGQDPWAHLALGQLALVRRQTETAVFAFERALELNPNFAAAHGRLGSALALDGKSERALEHLGHAMRLSPYDPQNAFLYAYIAHAHYQAKRYAEAVEYASKAVQLRPAVLGAHRVLCASLAMAGRIDDARASLRRLQSLQPNLSLAWAEQTLPLTHLPMKHLLRGLRKAGLQ